MSKKQHTFDTIVRHLHAQGKPSRDGQRCLYRGPNGTKCAVGVLIPDEALPEDFALDSALNTLRADGQEVLDLVPDEFVKQGWFLCRLQEVHDSAFGVEDAKSLWPKNLRYFADAHDLDSSLVDELWGPAKW